MLETAYYCAMAVAAIGALSGSRTACALLGGALLALALDYAGWHFNLVFWALIDVLVALAIIRPGMRRRDVAVLALYLPIFGFYLADEYTRYVAVTCIVIVQMLLTFPALRFWHRAKKTPLPDFNNPFDMRQTAQCYQPPK